MAYGQICPHGTLPLPGRSIILSSPECLFRPPDARRSYLHGPAQTWPLLCWKAMSLTRERSSSAALSRPPTDAQYCAVRWYLSCSDTEALCSKSSCTTAGGLDAQPAEGAWSRLDLVENAGCPVPISAWLLLYFLRRQLLQGKSHHPKGQATFGNSDNGKSRKRIWPNRSHVSSRDIHTVALPTSSPISKPSRQIQHDSAAVLPSTFLRWTTVSDNVRVVSW